MFSKLRNKKNNDTLDKDLKSYQKAAVSFEEDIYRNAYRSKRVAWIIAGISCFISFVLAMAIIKLAPMKEKIPYLLRVDNSTGIVDKIVTLYDDKEISANNELKTYFINKYINARESYQFKFAKENYRTTYFMSEKNLAKQFKHNYFKNSPVAIYGRDANVEVKIKSLELLKNNKAFIRIIKEVKHKKSAQKTGKIAGLNITHWVVRLSYDFINRLPQSVREITPVGFIITDYTITPENYHE